MRSNIIDIEVIWKHETEKAVLVAGSEDEKPVWLPKSQIEIDREGVAGKPVIISLPETLAEEKDLI